jgi:hypothetical protein
LLKQEIDKIECLGRYTCSPTLANGVIESQSEY